MAIHMNANGKASSKTTSTKATATAPERWVIVLEDDGDRKKAWLGVLSYPETARLSAKEVGALHATFGGDGRKTFRFHKFWGSHALEVAAPGRAWYWLCDVDGAADLPEVKALVAGALAKKAASSTSTRRQEADARGKKAAAANKAKAEASSKAKAEPAKSKVVFA